MVKSLGMHKAEETKSAPPSREPRKPCAGGIGNSIRPSGSRDRVILFGGGTCKNWLSRNGGPASWEVREGALRVVPGAGDILTPERFRDFFLHLEFLCPPMPGATGQDKRNNGVFLQGRYEI
jgi:3-keto-disaccharide hydrolase